MKSRKYNLIIYVSLFVTGLSIAWIFWQLKKPTVAPKAKIVSPEVEIITPPKKVEIPSCITFGSTPDRMCTPGAVNPKIEQKDIKNTICNDAYLARVQPSDEFMEATKLERLKAYGIKEDPDKYELDHLIPIEIGGNPTAIENLWPQIIKGSRGAEAKNLLEKNLHDQICSGERGMRLSQSAIASDWTKVE